MANVYEREAARRALYNAGLSDRQIAKELHTSKDTIRLWRHLRRLKPHHESKNPVRKRRTYKDALPKEQWRSAETFIFIMSKLLNYSERKRVQAKVDLEGLRQVYQYEMGRAQ